MIALNEIIYDIKARDGTYCCHPYEGHKNGCPNFPSCMKYRPDFKLLQDDYEWFAVYEEFNLKIHADKMKALHTDWSIQQCYCVLYWQGGVRKRLKQKAKDAVMSFGNGIILDIPEAHGINVFETMLKTGFIVDMKYHPDIVRKVMFVGKPK